MNFWVLKQLRACILSDLKSHIPEGYFEQKIDSMDFIKNFKGSEYISFELKWGYLAGRLGQKLYFQPPIDLTARQTAASELLMNLGMLASSEASLDACEQLQKRALELGVSDGNSGNIAKQLKNEHIPTLQRNIEGALEQYLHHLTTEEAKPYTSLITDDLEFNETSSQLKEDIIEIKPNFMGLGININALYRRLFKEET